DVISKLLHGFLPTVRALTDDEKDWQDRERLDVLEILNRRIAAQMPSVLASRLVVVLRDIQTRAASPQVRSRAGELLSEIKLTAELMAFDAFSVPGWDRNPGLPPEEMDRNQAEAITAGSDALKRWCKTPQDQISALEAFANGARLSDRVSRS